MSDEEKTIALNKTVITDEEAQFSGDVETPFVELVYQAAAPTPTTDKGSVLIYAMADGSLRTRLQAGVEINMSDRLLNPVGPFPFQGNIAAAADFPLPAANPAGVENGWTFLITADVTDNDATRTNTLQAFLAGAVISWNGVNWSQTDVLAYRTYMAATPQAVGAGDLVIIEVATTTIGGASVVNLPALTPALIGKKVLVVDTQGAAGANNIALTPNGANTINGVAGAWNIISNYGYAMVEAVQNGAGPATFGWVIVASDAASAAATARLAAIGAGRSHMDSRQGAAATETIRTFRAIAPGTIIGVTAEDGVVAAAAESMTLDVQIVPAGGGAGVSCLTAPVTLDNAVPIDTPVAGVLDPAAVAFATGDLVAVVRTYVPGGAPTPMSATVCDIELQFD